MMEVGVLVDFLADRCQVPADDVEFETDFDMPRTRLLTYEATGSESGNFLVTGLGGKNVIAVYRAGSYKRPIVDTPVITDKIQVVGTDLGNRKGILSTTGFVGLVAGDSLVPGEIVDFLIYE
jgi:hypothetical protein